MRILFKENQQKAFLNAVRIKLNKSLFKILYDNKIKIGVNYSTFKKYYREELLLPLDIANSLYKISGVNWEKFEIKDILDQNWGQKKGGKIGYKRWTRKYPNKIKEWRRKNIKKIAGWNMKNIKISKIDEKLAEFIGICLGDGTLTKYFVRISLDARNEEPYASYISNLCEEIFGIRPTFKKEKGKNTLNLKLFSIKVCNFLHKQIGLPYGHKINQKAKIPTSIYNDRTLMFSCIRGLVDTDGTISRGNNIYFMSHNKELLSQLIHFTRKNDIFTFFNNFSIGTSSWSKIIEYFTMIGSSNLKNVIRFHKRFSEAKHLYVNETVKFFSDYKNIELPFKLD